MELELLDVSKNFHDTQAVAHLHLHLQHGIYGLLGENGAGKTTLMRMLCTLLKPDSGQILYDGEDIFQLQEAYRDILGYLPQTFGYYPDFSGYDFLMYMASLKGWNRRDAKQRVNEVLAMVNLSDVAKKKLHSYSGGMIQRLGFAQAILNKPKILILDEPTAGLDPKERIRFRNIISALGQESIVLLSTHIVSDVEYIANKILIMHQGKLVKQGTMDELLAPMQNRVYEQCISMDQLSVYQATYPLCNIKQEQDTLCIRFLADHKPLHAHPVDACLEDVYLQECKQKEEAK